MKRKLMLLAGAAAMALSLTACGDDNGDENNNTNDNGSSPDFSTSGGIIEYLDSVSSILLEGTDFPTAPNGVPLNTSSDFCLHSTELNVTAASEFVVTTELGTFANSQCDTTTPSGETAGPFTSTAATITNVASDGSCFDITLDFPNATPPFAQVGRGSITATELNLELYYSINNPTGASCADGDPGASAVTITTTAGDATFPAGSGLTIQSYTITP